MFCMDISNENQPNLLGEAKTKNLFFLLPHVYKDFVISSEKITSMLVIDSDI